MKALFAAWLTFLGFLQFSHAAAPGSVYVVLSPYYQSQDQSRVFDTLVRLVREAPLGTRFVFLDGWSMQSIAEVPVPPSLRVNNPAAVLKHRDVRAGLGRVHLWLRRGAGSPPDPSLAGTALIDMPGALDLVSTTPAIEPRAILLIANALYHSATEPGFSFLPDRFPSDGSLFADKGSSVFSVVERRQRLKNSRVFLWYLKEGQFASDLYRDRVGRFWGLFISYQQGVLCGIGGDEATVLRGVFDAEAPPARQDGVDPAFAKVEMLSVVRPQPPQRRITNELGQVTFVVEQLPTPHQPSRVRAERDILQDLNSIPDNQTAVGVMWDLLGVDLDLYVWAKNGVVPLFFQNSMAPEGRYLHDYRDRNDQLDYEKVVLSIPPQPLESMEVAVNIYSGRANGPVTGKVFVRHEGRTYTGTFSLAAREGNRGIDRDERDHSPYWAKILIGKLQPVANESPRR